MTTGLSPEGGLHPQRHDRPALERPFDVYSMVAHTERPFFVRWLWRPFRPRSMSLLPVDAARACHQTPCRFWGSPRQSSPSARWSLSRSCVLQSTSSLVYCPSALPLRRMVRLRHLNARWTWVLLNDVWIARAVKAERHSGIASNGN